MAFRGGVTHRPVTVGGAPYREVVTIQAPVVWRLPAVGEWERLTRLPADLLQALLADPETVARYNAKVYQRGAGQCWPWVGALGSAGHGRLRCGTRALEPERPASRVIASHVFGWQLSRGILAADPVTGRLPLICHRCDEPSCHNPAHWVCGTAADNWADYVARRHAPGSPLTDTRGPRGRAVAIRSVILAALAEGAGAGEVEAAIEAAGAAGIPGAQGALF